jgi:hypothetical protein
MHCKKIFFTNFVRNVFYMLAFKGPFTVLKGQFHAIEGKSHAIKEHYMLLALTNGKQRPTAEDL